MARKSSKHNGGNNDKARGTGNGHRKKATRPPIIDVSATEVSDSKTQAEPQAQASNFTQTIGHLWRDLHNRFSGILGQWITFWMGPQKYLWMSGALVLVVIASLYALFSESAYRQEPVPDLQKLVQQRLAVTEKQIAAMQIQMAGLRGDIAKENVQQDRRVKQQSAQFAKITTNQETLVARISTMERALQATDGQINRQLVSIASNLEAMARKISAAGINTKNSDIALKAVHQRLKKLETASRQSSALKKDVLKAPTASQIARFKAAAQALIVVMQTQNGFAAELTEYAKTASDDPAVGLLKPYAGTGAPLIEQLRLRAEGFARPTDIPAAQSDKPDRTDFYGKIAAWSQTIIRVRRKADKPGDNHEQTRAWSKIASHLKSQHLGDGLAIALTLPGSKTHDDWVKQAQARLLIDRQIKTLTARFEADKSTKPQTRKGQ